MREARELREKAPIKAALLARRAVAIGILTIAPVRLGNLTRIKLEENLIRPAGPLSPYCLVFPNYDVKNRVKLEFVLKERLTKLIEEYVHDHRPVLLRGANSPASAKSSMPISPPALSRGSRHGDLAELPRLACRRPGGLGRRLPAQTGPAQRWAGRPPQGHHPPRPRTALWLLPDLSP
jgi:hypothetical protein